MSWTSGRSSLEHGSLNFRKKSNVFSYSQINSIGVQLYIRYGYRLRILENELVL